MRPQFNNVMKFFFTILLFCTWPFCHAQTKNIRVYVFAAEECPICIYMAKPLAAISTAYAGDASFYLVFPLKTSNSKTAAGFKTKNKLSNFSVIVDAKQTLTKKMGAQITPEVIITNAADSILYKGRINDAYLQPGKPRHIYNNNDLADALALITGQKKVPLPWRPAVGCYITFAKK